ncbi:hypothetical protein BD626DRAFT_401331 [Schizophyllum amplum]|uniref:DUF7918 domain-containing protein n=1 Tax=Schizophyllum amplum TaxID=97359 RepID=A0A550CIB9_9AGAR|nr:hypothetical protein BD626DRAFT_401331 [Auriculariopsis ampla]
MKIERFECCIQVGGKPLDEYGVELSEDGKTCSAWIPSEVGQEFSIRWCDPVRARCTVAEIDIDGVELYDCPVSEPSRTDDQTVFEHVYISPTEYRDLSFAELVLTDDDTYLQKNQRGTGEIRMAIWACRVIGEKPFGCGLIAEASKVHEKTKKGLAHTVVYGGVKEAEQPVVDIKTEKLDKEPLATFTFLYRSLDMLRANGIAPIPEMTTPSRSSSTDEGPSTRKRKASEALTPEPAKVKKEMIDLEEIERAEEHVRRMEEQLRQARFEMHRSRGNTRVKLEDVLPVLPGEVIDLTDD